MNGMRLRSIVVAMLLLASVVEFSVRGPARLVQSFGWNDFLAPYIQAKAWVQGKNPYSAQSLVSLWPADNQRPPWVDAEAANGTLEMKRGMPTPYPISSLVILSPFTLLSWSVALRLWILVTVGAVVLSPFALLSICGCSLFDLRSQLFLAAVFALAPLHTGLGTANPAMLAVSLMVMTVWAARSGLGRTAGVLLAIAVCLKPTVAGGLLLYYLIRRQRKVAIIACGFATIILIVGVSRLALAGVPWLPSYFENTRRIFAAGSLADFTRPDPVRFNMINAQVLFYGLLGSASLANLLSRLLGAALLGWWLWLCFRRPVASELLEISAVSIVSLIAVYHRSYDSALLVWVLAWSVLLVKKRSTTLITLVTILPFLVPGPPLLSELVRAGRIPPTISSGWLWNNLVMPHEIWALIFLAIFLLYSASEGVEERPLPVSPGPIVNAFRPPSAPCATLPSSPH